MSNSDFLFGGANPSAAFTFESYAPNPSIGVETMVAIPLPLQVGDNVASSPKSLKHSLQMLEDCAFTKATRKRIVELAYKEEGWDFGYGLSLNPVSLIKFLSFWLAVKANKNEPELFLCQNGNLQAEWYKNSKNNLILEFTPNSAMCILNCRIDPYIGKDTYAKLVQRLGNHTSLPLKW
jgi:hypothetical protein